VSEPRFLASSLADWLRADRDLVTERWLERISARVTIEPNGIFPSQDLLDHVPRLVQGVADYIEHPEDVGGLDTLVIAKARELGVLRHTQGFDAYEILKEFEIFGNVIFTHLAERLRASDEPSSREALLECTQRIFRAVTAIQQATTAQFLELAAARTHEREDRLRGFNRLVSHELKNRVHAIIGAHAMLREPFIVGTEHDRFMGIIGRNAEGLQITLAQLLDLSRLESDVRQHKNVLVGQAVAESVRQLREAAQAAGVTVHLHEPVPQVEVNAAVVELCLANYLSNAIKYADPTRTDRRADILVRLDPDAAPWHPDPTNDQVISQPSPPGMLVVEVRDNGLGIPNTAADRLFERFFRAHTTMAPRVSGSGLGLNIVRETVHAMGGDVWAAPNKPAGSIFGFSLPCRRTEDGA